MSDSISISLQMIGVEWQFVQNKISVSLDELGPAPVAFEGAFPLAQGFQGRADALAECLLVPLGLLLLPDDLAVIVSMHPFIGRHILFQTFGPRLAAPLFLELTELNISALPEFPPAWQSIVLINLGGHIGM